jgi:excisionase family DNA binding protein
MQPTACRLEPRGATSLGAPQETQTDVEVLMNVAGLRLLSVTEVAEATGLSPNAVYRAIWAGELLASKLRGRLRIQVADLEDWIASNRVSTSGEHDKHPALARPPGRNGPGRGLRELLKAQ